MSRHVLATVVFAGTLGIVWLITSNTSGNKSTLALSGSDIPHAAEANIYLQSGGNSIPDVHGATPPMRADSPSLSPSPSPSPTNTLLVPQFLVTSSPSSTTTPTPTRTPSPTPITTRTQTPTPTILATPTPTATLSVVPSPTATPSQTTPATSITILTLTSPVAQKQTANIKIQSESAIPCGITVILPSGTQSTSKNLVTKTTDFQGITSWSWDINWNTKTGTATIKLSCTRDGQTASGQTTMEIIASQ